MCPKPRIDPRLMGKRNDYQTHGQAQRRTQVYLGAAKLAGRVIVFKNMSFKNLKRLTPKKGDRYLCVN